MSKLIFWFRNGLLVILLMSFWLMFHISSFNTNIKAYHEYLVSKIKNTTSPEETVGVANASSSKTLSEQVLGINEIRRRIDEYNKLQTVLNEDIFGPLRNDSAVVVVQVHNRLMYLKHAINSIAQTKGIENALLVFSHDYYDEEMNNFIQSIDFCKVMQIFYPYSIQTHPNKFPGQSKNDCPKDINIEEAVKRKCINALHPDLNGHYREAKFTQAKHHWWWKASRVFDGLNATKNYTGLMTFLEEDHYVAPDFIHMLHLMEYTRQSACPDCQVLSLGSHLEDVDFAVNSKIVEITPWSSGMQNMGMTFNRSVWEEFKSCAKMFCSYDDYNWDWTLLAVSNKCLPKEITAMVLRATRVFHIGECGMHIKNNCTSKQMLKRTRKLLSISTAYFFPQELNITYTVPWEYSYLKDIVGNGGWGDIRDHNLCLKIVEPSS